MAQTFKCNYCGHVFVYPKRVKEPISMDYYISVCPNCGFDSYWEVEDTDNA